MCYLQLEILPPPHQIPSLPNRSAVLRTCSITPTACPAALTARHAAKTDPHDRLPPAKLHTEPVPPASCCTSSHGMKLRGREAVMRIGFGRRVGGEGGRAGGRMIETLRRDGAAV